MPIPFTQYLLPDGATRCIAINLPRSIELLAAELINSGARFELELLGDLQTVSLECVLPRKGEDPEVLAGELVSNGPAIPPAVERLVVAAGRAMVARPDNDGTTSMAV